MLQQFGFLSGEYTQPDKVLIGCHPSAILKYFDLQNLQNDKNLTQNKAVSG